MRKRNILIACIGGIALLFTPCIPKLLTGHPCPACGTRRAMVAALKGDLLHSLEINPYGILFLLIALIVIVGLVFEAITHKTTFTDFYHNHQRFLSNKYVLFLVAICMLLNWAWNIQKGI